MKVCKQGDILLCPRNWKKQQLVELDDHCTFLLTFWLTTLVDRPVTSALHRSEYYLFTTWIRRLIPGFDRWDSLWMRLGFGKLKDSQTPRTLWNDAEALVDEALERPKDFIDSSLTTSIQISHIAYQLTVAPAWCVQWRDLTYIMTRDWREQTLVTKRTHLFVHSCVQLTGHTKAGWIWWWKTIFQSFLKSADKTLIIEEILEDHWRFSKKSQTTFHGLTSIMEEIEGRTEFSSLFELWLEIPTWRTTTHFRKHLHVQFELWLKYFRCDKKWRILNHPPFSVKIVCFVSSCGVYALDDH